MNTTTKYGLPSLVSLVAVGLFLTSFALLHARRDSEATKGEKVLTLGIYPWVPRPTQFKEVIQKEWQKVAPDIKLKFVSSSKWGGGYDTNPSDDLDVFVFDAVFLEYFISQGLLEPLKKKEINKYNDILPYARAGVQKHGKHYGIPQIGCGSMLLYRKGDNAIKNAKGFSDIYKTIGQCPYKGKKPPKGKGLIVDLSGKTTNFCFYTETLEDQYGVYNPDPPMPAVSNNINSLAVRRLQKLLQLTSHAHANTSDYDGSIDRSAYFSQGLGRAMVGYTEKMSAMTNQALRNVEIRLMPFSDKNDVHLFYADIVGVNPNVKKKGMRKAALKLANLLASKKVMVGSIAKRSKDAQLQYLLPVRTSVFLELAKKDKFAIYPKLHRLVKNNQPRLFKLGTESRELTKKMGKIIRTQVFADKTCEAKE